MNHGMEMWHPNPDFFFLPGGGPMLDLGPYYIANLINLIGPVRRVARPHLLRQPDPHHHLAARATGEVIPVKTPTNIHALLEFHNGATVTLSTSWDVWSHKRVNMELYGTEGTLFVPDPNFFGGTVEIGRPRRQDRRRSTPGTTPSAAEPAPPAGASTWPTTAPRASPTWSPPSPRAATQRCSLERTLHGVEVMTAVLKSGETGAVRHPDQTTCTRPAALSPAQAQALLK